MSSELQKDAAATVTQESEGNDLLSKILSEGRLARNETQTEQATDMIKEFVQQVMQGELVMSRDMEATINARIAAIDKLVSSQLNMIMHHEDFQKLEGSWRGLNHLVMQSETGTGLKIRVLNASKKDLFKDLEKAVEFDQSALFKKVYEEEFGTFGGAPFGALIGDFDVGRQAEDMYFAEQMSHVAAAAHAPFIAAAAPELFGLESFTDLGKPRDLAKVFDTVEYAKWKSFREAEDSRYVGLTLPRFLGRLPFNPKEGSTTEGFNFVEDVTGVDHSKYLWINTAYAMAARLTSAFETYGWCAAIRGVEGGGLVEDLPTHTFRTDDGEIALKCPTEISITDRREKELSDLGFIPLIHCKNTDYAAFFGAQSAQKAKKYDSDSANANASLSGQLQYMFAVCRIAHYMKAMMRDKIGSFASAGDIQAFLMQWIAQYVTTDESASQDAKARYPLREASIEVSEIPGRPGVYRAVSFVRPHFQLDELSVSLRLVAELPSGGKG